MKTATTKAKRQRRERNKQRFFMCVAVSALGGQNNNPSEPCLLCTWFLRAIWYMFQANLLNILLKFLLMKETVHQNLLIKNISNGFLLNVFEATLAGLACLHFLTPANLQRNENMPAI